MKAPTKAELYAQIEALIKENATLYERLNAEQKIWFNNRDMAFIMFYRLIPFDKKDIYNLTLEHIDYVGYWFTFEICNDSTRQTYCVRHTDL
jgi:hypothetical protein